MEDGAYDQSDRKGVSGGEATDKNYLVLRQLAAVLIGCCIRCLRIKIDDGMTPTAKNNLHTNLDVTEPLSTVDVRVLIGYN